MASSPILDRDLLWIDPNDVDFGKRYREDMGDFDVLLEDIKERGIIQSITVLRKDSVSPEDLLALEPENDDAPYLLLAGGRRTTAALELDLDRVPAQVYNHVLDKLELRIIELHENIFRESLTFVEDVKLRAEIHQLQVEKYGEKVSTAKNAPGVSLATTAEMLGVSKATMSQDVRLAQALEEHPELANAESKADAWKQYDAMVKKMAMQILAERQRSRVDNNPTSSNETNVRRAITTLYRVGSFFEGVKPIPDESVKIVEIDPPYAIDLKKIKKSGDTEDYNEIDVVWYESFMQQTLAEAYRVMKPHSWLICWFGPDPWFDPLYHWIVAAGKPDGVELDEWIKSKKGFQTRRLPGVWMKRNGQTQQPDRYLASATEYFFYARKGDPGLNKQGRTNVYDFATVPAQKKRHPTERPIEMIEAILETFGRPGDVVMTPFAGSGNTILAAQNLNMPAFGFDLSQPYKDSFDVTVMTGPLKAWKSYS